MSIKQYLFVFVLFISSSVNALTDDEYIQALLLSSNTSDGVRLAGRLIRFTPESDPIIAKFAADQLIYSLQNPVLDEDAKAWLAKLLGKTKDQSFRSILELAQTLNPPPKVEKHIQAALRLLGEGNGKQYVTNEKTREQHLAVISSSRSTIPYRPELKADFLALEKETELSTIFQTFGYPGGSSTDVNIRDLPRFGSTRTQQLLLTYPKLGALQLYRSRGIWRLSYKMPYPDIQIDDSADQYIVDEIWNWSYPRIIQFFSHNKARKFTQQQLDILAYRVWLGVDTIDPFLADSLCHLANFVRAGGRGRYQAIMTDTAMKAKDGKLRKYSKKAAKRGMKYNDQSPEEQFMPYGVELNLDELEIPSKFGAIKKLIP